MKPRFVNHVWEDLLTRFFGRRAVLLCMCGPGKGVRGSVCDDRTSTFSLIANHSSHHQSKGPMSPPRMQRRANTRDFSEPGPMSPPRMQRRAKARDFLEPGPWAHPLTPHIRSLRVHSTSGERTLSSTQPPTGRGIPGPLLRFCGHTAAEAREVGFADARSMQPPV